LPCTIVESAFVRPSWTVGKPWIASPRISEFGARTSSPYGPTTRIEPPWLPGSEIGTSAPSISTVGLPVCGSAPSAVQPSMSTASVIGGSAAFGLMRAAIGSRSNSIVSLPAVRFAVWMAARSVHRPLPSSVSQTPVPCV
jgi:hypothetical protein